MSEFRPRKLYELAHTFAGGTPDRTRSDFFGGDVPWIKSTEVNLGTIRSTEETLTELGLRASAAKWTRTHSIVLALYGATAGQVAFLEIDATANQAVLSVVPSDNVKARFLYYALLQSKPRLLYLAQGSGQPNLSKQIVDQLELHVPSQLVQQCIADILSTVDETIAQTEALIAKMQQIKASLMHDLFTRGVTPDGQLRPPRSEAPQLYKESPLGWIPKEWDVTTLGAISDLVTSGSRGWAAYYTNDGPLFIRIGNLTREHPNLRLDDVVHVKPPLSSEGQRTRLMAGDLLISITADLGIVGVVPNDFGEAYINQHIALVRPKVALGASRWLGHWLGGPYAQARIRRLDDPGAKAGLNLPIIRSFPIVMSQKYEQDVVVDRLDAADGAIQVARESAKKQQLLKSGLMHELLTGRVRVPVAEAPDAASAG